MLADGIISKRTPRKRSACPPLNESYIPSPLKIRQISELPPNLYNYLNYPLFNEAIPILLSCMISCKSVNTLHSPQINFRSFPNFSCNSAPKFSDLFQVVCTKFLDFYATCSHPRFEAIRRPASHYLLENSRAERNG